ncbi:hypothetical protein F5Y04DRAFT_82032 [Hypomontagnella monticulosa]|nr:hypothetical protein F5Y04DRAFT_82032 [Hypomontagnella monticulosa]
MSAFALRKRLLSQQTTPTPPVTITTDDISSVSSTPDPRVTRSRSPKKSKKVSDTPSTLGHEVVPNDTPKDSAPVDTPTEDTAAPDYISTLSRSPSSSIADDEVLIRPVKATPVQLSNFKPTKANYQKRKDGRIVLKLSDGERLVILGSYGLRVTSGEITINGATLGNSDRAHWVHAPHCHALPVIRCPDAANLELHPDPTAVDLRSLGRLSPQFRRLWNESSDKITGASDSTFQILYTSADGPKRTMLQDLISPPEWNRGVAKFVSACSTRPCSIMVTGPKSSGKSTFGKILANRLITDQSNGTKHRAHRGVVVLDFDPGQPEYCIAGQISLVFLSEPVFGPSFCHPLSEPERRIVRSHALASISPASDPELYLEAAMDLMTHYQNTLGSYPLIINTPGWIQGTGLDLLTSLIDNLRPTEVVYMSESGPAEVVETLRESCKVTSFSTLPSQASQSTSRTAAHLRSMQTMSYFHAEPRGVSASRNLVHWNPKPLTTIPPWQVNYKGSNRGIFGVMCYDYQAPLDLLADAINGTVLAVVAVESTKALRYTVENAVFPSDGTANLMDVDVNDNEPQESTLSPFSRLESDIITTTPEGILFIDTTNGATLDPKYSHSLGLALVRGIDVENGVIQLLTPLSAEEIEEVTSKGGEIVLVSGKFDPPSWAYTEDSYYRSHSEVDDGTDLDEPMEDDAEDDSDAEIGDMAGPAHVTPVPWIEILHGNQKRGAGSKVWRVRRDLGRAGN